MLYSGETKGIKTRYYTVKQRKDQDQMLYIEATKGTANNGDWEEGKRM